jgi:hypothetical protein
MDEHHDDFMVRIREMSSAKYRPMGLESPRASSSAKMNGTKVNAARRAAKSEVVALFGIGKSDEEIAETLRREMMTKPLPRQQQRVLDFISAEVGAGRKFPTKREIADHMGWKGESGSNDVLNALAYKGRLDRRDTKGRGWEFSLPAVGETEA